MPYVLVANRTAIEGDATYLARCLGLGGGLDAVLAWVLRLRREIGIPATLSAVGIPADEVGRVAQMAVKDPSAGANPISFTAADYAALFERALSGDLPRAALRTLQ